MKIIQNNPYRIAGILANATAKELQKQKGKIKAFARVGREITSEFDFKLLDKIERTEQTIGKAFSNIEQNQDKVNNSLFWFLEASPFDETAISYLIKGDNEKANEIWEKITGNKEVNSTNFSAFNNIGTLKLLSNSEFEIKQGIEAKIKLIESEYFENFVHTVADQTFTIDNRKQTEKLIDELLTQFKNQYSSADALDLFSNCNSTTQKYLSKKFTETPTHNIESNIESTKRKRNSNKSDAYKFGVSLAKKTKDDLSLLKSLLGASDLKYKMIADNLAKEIMQCGIDYFQEWKESKDPSKDGLKLLKYAKSVAIGSQTKDRVKQNIEGIEEWAITAAIKADLDAIITLLDDDETDELSSLPFERMAYLGKQKDTIGKAESLIKKATPHLINIKAVLKGDNEMYLSLSTNLVAKAQNFVIETINSAQQRPVVFGEVDIPGLKLKLKNAWKVIQLLGSLDMVYEFQDNYENNKKALKNLFKQLDLNTTNYNFGKIPQLNFIVKDSEIKNTGENNSSILNTNLFYDKYVRYIRLNLNVIGYNAQEIEFFLKYVNPDGKHKSNSKTSPKGYTFSSTKSITSFTKEISFSGWGNSKECTYQLGRHNIEVWVDDFMIYKKEFTIDLSPSQKIGKKIKQVETKLKEIRQTNYLASGIISDRNEMSEIIKFKLFRGSSEKQRQIETKKQKIDSLLERSNQEKKKNIAIQEEKIYKLKIELSAAKY